MVVRGISLFIEEGGDAMKRFALSVCAAALGMGMAVFGDAAGSPARAACVMDVAAWDVLWMRSGPSVRYRRIGSIPPRACGIRVNWNTCRGKWCKVSYAGQHGWVNTRYLDEGGDGYGGGETLGMACVQGVRPDDVLWMRTGPGVRFRRESSLPFNECNIRVINNCRGNWCIVETSEGATGWVNTRYLRIY